MPVKPKLIALVTNADRLFNFWLKECLIQRSARADAKDITIDSLDAPLRLKDQQPLDEKLNTIEVVMHTAENDVLLLSNEFGFRIPRVFNSKLAACILDLPLSS